MKLINNMKKERKDNRGFSLVELIIVIAIMAILVGIVGTQVIPYLNRSREAKDLQLLNSYSTAAVSAYSMNVDTLGSGDIGPFDVYGASLSADEQKLADEIKTLTGYSTLAALTAKMGSTTGKAITQVTVEVKVSTGEVIVTGTGSTLDQVKSYI